MVPRSTRSRAPAFPLLLLLAGWLGGLPAVAAQEVPARVEVASITRASMAHTVTLSGSLRSPQSSAISARVAGYVTGFAVEAGTRVVPGQLLLTLDDEIAGLELKRREAVLREAEALVADQQRRVSEAADLIEANNFSRSELASLRAELAARRARLAQFRVETEIQRTRLGHHRVTAPFPGMVTERMVEVGNQVSADTPLLGVARMDPLWAEVQLPQRYLNQIDVGTPVRVSPDYSGGEWLAAEVSSLVRVSTDGSRTFLVRCELDNPEWRLAPGMSLSMELALGGNEPVLQVPADAITHDVGGRTRVWIVQESSADTTPIATPLDVEVGRRAGDRVEVTGEGLGPGARVIVRGNEGLRPGQAVAISRAGA